MKPEHERFSHLTCEGAGVESCNHRSRHHTNQEPTSPFEGCIACMTLILLVTTKLLHLGHLHDHSPPLAILPTKPFFRFSPIASSRSQQDVVTAELHLYPSLSYAPKACGGESIRRLVVPAPHSPSQNSAYFRQKGVRAGGDARRPCRRRCCLSRERPE